MAAMVNLPPGVEHYKTTAFARSWRAYDALTDGWEQKAWHVGPDGRSCDPTDPGARLHVNKQATIDGHQVVVSPPHDAREGSE